MKALVLTLSLFVTASAWAGPIDDCYSDNYDVKEASLCADKVLARQIRRISKGSTRELKSCSLNVCVWGGLDDPEDRHEKCKINSGEWRYHSTFFEARDETHAVIVFAEKYENVAEAQAAVNSVSCN